MPTAALRAWWYFRDAPASGASGQQVVTRGALSAIGRAKSKFLINLMFINPLAQLTEARGIYYRTKGVNA